MTLATFIQASAHQLDGIADGSVQAIVCSPPYYGLRAYQGDQNVEWPAVEYAPMPGLPPIRIAGCEPGCEHEWQDGPKSTQRIRNGDETSGIHKGRATNGLKETIIHNLTQGAYCAKCGGWRGGLGNEPTLEAYIGHLILCLREWRRVLRDDGVCFVNLGDSFSGSGGAGGDYNEGGLRAGQPKFKAGKSNGLKPKDLMMVPARFALAAQADGWWLRSDIIGHKIAPMPESVTDRPTRSHEHIFMLTKASRYYFDMDAVREPYNEASLGRYQYQFGKGPAAAIAKSPAVGDGTGHNAEPNPAGRQMRDVIEWRPSPFPGAHFACWPEAIPEKLIRAATSERGACPHCGAPWRRVVEREGGDTEAMNRPKKTGGMNSRTSTLSLSGNGSKEWAERGAKVKSLGFEPSCACAQHEPVPCVVLDPFSGSGTTCKVAVRLGRRALGVDIAAEYLDDVTALRFGAGVQMELTGTL